MFLYEHISDFPAFIREIEGNGDTFLLLRKTEKVRSVYQLDIVEIPVEESDGDIKNYRFLKIISAMDFARSDSTGRDISAASVYSPVNYPGITLVAVLYAENKIEILDFGAGFVRLKVLQIQNWSPNEPETWTQGYVEYLPYSNFVLAAKQGEKKLVIKNYH